MSDARRTEILEKNIEQGWTCTKITASGAEVKTVKATPGKVAMILVTSAVNVTPKDHETAKWEVVNNTTLDWSASPVTFNTSIKLDFAGAASAWIIYK
jgi:hypothetical protein